MKAETDDLSAAVGFPSSRASARAATRQDAASAKKPVTNGAPAAGARVDMHLATHPTDSELLRRYERDGQQSAFTALVNRYQAMVLGAAYRRTENYEIARDVAQEVFAALARKATFLLGRESLGGWLHQAAVYESVRALRSEARRHGRQHRYATEMLVAETEVLGSAETARETSVIDEAIDSLAPPDREVLVLHYFQDLSYPEMAKVLKANEPAVRKRVSRALERLSTQLNRRGVASDVVSVLIAAAAIQTTLIAPAGLAQAALAGAAAGAGASAFLTLTAVLPHAAVKTALLALAVAGTGLLWTTTQAPRPGPDAPPSAAAAISSRDATTAARPLAVPDWPPQAALEPPSSTAAVDGQREQMPRSIPDRLLPGGTHSGNQAGAPVFAALPQARPVPVPAPARQVAAESSRAVPPAAAGRKAPSDPSRPRASIGSNTTPKLAELLGGQLPATLGEIANPGDIVSLVSELQRMELLPDQAAELYARVLGEVLALNPLEQGRAADSLLKHFERLNLLGMAGPPPSAIPEEVWRPQRDTVLTSAAKEITSSLPEAATAAPELVEAVLKLPDTPTGEPVGTVAGSVSGVAQEAVPAVGDTVGSVLRLP